MAARLIISMRRHVRVLLIEDNEPDVFLVRRLLGKSQDVHFEVEQTHALSAGLKRLTSGWFDAVVLDLGLPDSYGLKALETLHGLVPDLPVIVLSGYEDPRRAAQAL